MRPIQIWRLFAMTEMPTNPKRWHVGLVGYGEVGRILAEDLRQQDVGITAYDLKLGNDQAGPLRDHASAQGVALAASHGDLAAKADFIVSAVTASRPSRSRRLARLR